MFFACNDQDALEILKGVNIDDVVTSVMMSNIEGYDIESGDDTVDVHVNCWRRYLAYT